MENFSKNREMECVVSDDGNGVRLDIWLAGRFSYRSRTAWSGTVKAGEILLNGRAARPSSSLSTGDIVRFIPTELEEPPVDTAVEIIYEDDDILVVDKPGNLPCHPGGAYFAHTLWAILREKYGEVHIATRLDRETSGLVVAGKNPKAAAALAKGEGAFSRKIYNVVVHGRFPDGETVAEGFIRGRRPDEINDKNPIRKKRIFETHPTTPESQSAKTIFGLLSRGKLEDGGELSLLEAELETGRTHQIRATALHLGYPVLGDKIYGLNEGFFARFADGVLTDEDKRLLVLDRQALHCREVELRHPATGERMTFESRVPRQLSVFFPLLLPADSAESQILR